MTLMMEKQSMRPNSQASKESTFVRYILYAEIIMQPVHRNLSLHLFDFSFQCRMFLVPSVHEAFTLKCSMYLKFLLQFVWKYSILLLPKQSILSESYAWNFYAETQHVQEISVEVRENSFVFIFIPWPLILKLRNHGNSFSKTLFWKSHFRRYNQPLSRVEWWMCSEVWHP